MHLALFARFRLLLICSTVLLSACGSIDVSAYRDSSPTFVAEEFFDGPLIASGVLKDRSGKVTRKFTADIKAYWRDGVGTLEEDFLFDDGEVSPRVWTLTPNGPNRYQATAGDVVGPGAASVSGNAMFLKYVLRVPYSGNTIDLSVDDRMYLVSPDVLLNESVMSKFGVRVAEIVLSIRRLEE
ncbi:MAG: DUF3833 domain-containing protein [Pseudomonadota bacterium]